MPRLVRGISDMIKYVPSLTSVVMEEIPDRVTLAVEISNCRGNCEGCHSPFLKEDIGKELTPEIIAGLVADNFGVNCFLFLGEGQDPVALVALARFVRTLGLQPALYSGRSEVDDAYWDVFDYVKLGPYVREKGPLNQPTTNQRLYRVMPPEEVPPVGGEVTYHGTRPFLDITYRFWRRGIETR